MNKTLLSFLLLSSYLSFGQSCHEANESFVAMADDAEFVESHELPESSGYEHGEGEYVMIGADGERARAYVLKADESTDKWLLVFHEWWGLNDNIEREVNEWAIRLGINVMAVDMYDGQIATTREAAGQLMQSANSERIEVIIEKAFEYMGEDARVGTIGWCFGGGWSMQAALIGNEHVDACIVYYGMPELDVERLETLNAPVLGIFASRDQWINDEVTSSFEQAMADAEKELHMFTYDAKHAFANPSNEDVYDRDAALDAQEKATAFLMENLIEEEEE